MTAPVRIKRGETLSLTANFANADGSAYVLDGVTLLAHVRDAEMNLIAALTPTPTTVAGQALILVQDTSAWPEGMLRLDVLVQPAGSPQVISDTIGVYVARAITQLLPEQADYDPVIN